MLPRTPFFDPVAQLDSSNSTMLWNIIKLVKKGSYLYALVPEHPNATKNGYILHHRVVMENHLNKILDIDKEIVHHINGNTKDNRVENLQVMERIEHILYHSRLRGSTYVDLKCPECKVSFTRRKNNTHLTRGGKYTSCCRRCKGKFSRRYQLKGCTQEYLDGLAENVIRVYKKAWQK